MTEDAPGQGLTAERLREVLSYNRETGEFHWRHSGKKAGCLDVKGYVVIRVDWRLYRAGRLAWLYVTGEWPPHQIDHRNQVRSDDRWDNLRLATNSQNNMNRTLPKANTSGARGVYWSARKERWVAEIKVNCRKTCLGYFRSKDAARQAYANASAKMHGEFARPYD